MPQTQDGTLLIADISGYTKFLTSTELEHSREILSELLETVIRSLKGRLEVAGLEGDAVFFAGSEAASRLLDELRQTFVSFHSRIRDLQLGTHCTCGACSNVGALNLKFVVHHGRWSRQRVGTAEQLIGPDVIVVHRLLKNRVPSHEYVLATAPALERLGPREGFTDHVEEYDVGRVEGAYADLGEAWREALARERRGVEESEARLRFDYELDAPIATVWRMLTDPELRGRLTQDTSNRLEPGPRGALVGGALHCRHGSRETLIRFLDAEEPRTLSVVISERGLALYLTTLLEEVDASRTRCTDLAWWAEPKGLAGLPLRLLLPGSVKANGRRQVARAQALALELSGGPV